MRLPGTGYGGIDPVPCPALRQPFTEPIMMPFSKCRWSAK